MTPFDLILWALAAAVAIVIVGIALAIAVGVLQSARPSKPAPNPVIGLRAAAIMTANEARNREKGPNA